MCQQEDKCKLLLNKISKLDNDLCLLIQEENNINELELCKIDNTLYKAEYSADNDIVCWYGYDANIQKFIRTYKNKNPIDVYIYIDEITHKIVELEFLDWANQICESENSCIDFILSSEIKIEYLPR
jgi:hypothetical protein